MSRARVARRAIGVAGLALGAVAVPLALLLLVTSVRGDRLVVVESGSMAPTYATGSLLVVSPARSAEIGVGDVIAYADESRGGALVSHRVVSVLEGDEVGARSFLTQGDANATVDPEPVGAAAVRGRVVRALPGLGALDRLLDRTTALVLLVGLPLVLLALDSLLARLDRSSTDPEASGGDPTAAGPPPAAVAGA